jgi:competence protein ComEA
MSEIPRSQLVLYAAAALAVLALGLHQLRSSAPASRAVASPGAGYGSRAAAGGGVRLEGTGGTSVVVQVAGAVRSPGVYRLPAGKRVDDAVRMAGGPTARADLSGVNLAAKAEDGRQVIVPERAPGGGAATAAGGAAGAAAATAGAPAVAGAAAAPLNLNTATSEQLDTLDGVGPATAQKILAYRQAHNGFGSVSELGQVPGIGEKKLAALRQQVTV